MRDGCSGYNSGILFPIRVLKSPHINVVSYGCMVSSNFSISNVACVSCIFLLLSEVVGGMYMLTMFIL